MMTSSFLLLVLLSLSNPVIPQTCHNVSQYDQCSTNAACGCFHLSAAYNTGICGLLWVTCASLVACVPENGACYEPNHLCVHHPSCHNLPICYPLSMAAQGICPPLPPPPTTTTIPITSETTTTATTTTTNPPSICASATWNSKGVTVAGGKEGSAFSQLRYPWGLFVDDDRNVYVADTHNHRVVKWLRGASSGQVVAGGDGAGSGLSSLDRVTNVIVDKNGTMFICDHGNRRVLRWYKSATYGQAIMTNVPCLGLAMDDEGSLYVSRDGEDRITKWPGGQIVAGGNGIGTALNQLSRQHPLFVDRNRSIFVADHFNHRIMKWSPGSQIGMIVAGGNGRGDEVNQLNGPIAVAVDQMSTVYVLEYFNHRIMRWFKGANTGSLIIGGRGPGNGVNQLHSPYDITFDRYGNLYVTDSFNHRVQMFAIDRSSCP